MARIFKGEVYLDSTGQIFPMVYETLLDRCFDVIRTSDEMQVTKIVAKAIQSITGEKIQWGNLRNDFSMFPKLETAILRFSVYSEKRTSQTNERREKAKIHEDERKEQEPIQDYIKHLNERWRKLGYKNNAPCDHLPKRL